MTDAPTSSADSAQGDDQVIPDRSFLEAMLLATPAQRLAWLEEALCVAYACGALKPRKLIGKEEWEAMGSSPR
ncbi:MAG: hypothetical protein ACRD2L_00470 [Terriglobia bacterium]